MRNINNTKIAIGIFIVSPILSLIVLARQYRSKLYLNLIWFFFAFLGYILVTSNEFGDSSRYSKMFTEYANMSFEDQVVYFKEDAKLDLFRPLSFKLVSLFTDNDKFYFAFVAFFFGFFYSRILNFLIINLNQYLTFFTSLVLINFLFLMNFYGFQFVRFNTATVLFVYFILKFYLEEKKVKYLVFASLSVLIHFTYVFPVSFLILYQFLPKYKKLFLYGFLVTSLFTFFEFSTLAQNIESVLPTELESRKSYLDSDYKTSIEESSNQVNWYIKIRGPLIKYTFLILIIQFLLFFKDKINYNKKYDDLLGFLFFFGIFANIVSVVPSGSRFLSIVYGTIWLLLITILINNRALLMQKPLVKYYLYFFFGFNLVIGVRYLFDIFPIEFFIGNFITVMIDTTDISMIEYIKNFIS